MTLIKKTFTYGGDTITLETGILARQATSAVLAKMGDTAVLVTVVANKEPSTDDFFPLSVYYQEKTYAAGRIPGGFFKREGRPTEKETLTSRLIDRPIRPLFPNMFHHEVQIIATVLSSDCAFDADIISMLGTSAALALSGLPFNGPMGAARVGTISGRYVLNPRYQELEKSELDLVVAGTAHGVLMVESEAKQLSETMMLGAVLFGHQEMQKTIEAISEFAKMAPIKPFIWSPFLQEETLQISIKQLAETDLKTAYQIENKLERKEKLEHIRARIVEHIVKQSGTETTPSEKIIRHHIDNLEKEIVRTYILEKGVRIDGRDTKTVRPITIQAGLLPRTHGSALFTRGETQALVVTTLGAGRDAQIVDALEGERKDHFLLHYNFPPFSVGETGQVGAPKRREIGHGRLAKRALAAVVPSQDVFPYVIRLVSEITESNGSSSMASVCGGSLSLMDAGVPILAPVAGIAMGLIQEGARYAVLSDILGDEDHLGDMDFKVAGTAKGITALQMDIKIDRITPEIMQVALEQAREGRQHILSCMNPVLSAPRAELSRHAPRITSFTINPEKIRDVIGKGGSTIRALIEETGVSIDITDDGTVKIGSTDEAKAESARKKIELIATDVEVGKIYDGKVTKILDFGAVVSLAPNKEGLVHISEISHERIAAVGDVLIEGQLVRVKVIEIDRMGRARLSMKRV